MNFNVGLVREIVLKLLEHFSRKDLQSKIFESWIIPINKEYQLNSMDFSRVMIYPNNTHIVPAYHIWNVWEFVFIPHTKKQLSSLHNVHMYLT